MIEYENLSQLNKPFKEEFVRAFENVLDSGWFILGDKVKCFEKEFAEYCGTNHCIGVGNCLDALTIALRIFNFSPQSEVLVPSNTYIATVLSILHNGLKPVLIEPDIRTYNIDPARIEEGITPKTKAIMIVHLYGKMCDMDPIMAIAKKNNLLIIEDCAQAHGALYKGKKSGSFGSFGAFSYYPTKNLGALADAGSLVTSDDSLAEKARVIRNYGSNKKYYNETIGFNSRLDEVQAAFLSVKLKALDDINRHKKKLASLYFKDIKSDYILPDLHQDFNDVFHIFSIRHKRRDRLKEFLLQNNIKTEIHYPVAPNKQLAMKGIFDGQSTPIAEEIHNTTLSLPISYCHSEEDVFRVIEALNKF